MVCLIPSLPTTLFAHPFPRHVCQCLAPIKSSLTSRSLGLPCPISAHHLFCSLFPQTCSPVLGSYQVLTHLKIAWFALSHLCPPPFLLTLSPDMFTSAWLLSSPHSPQDRLVCLVPSLPTTFFAHPFPRHVHQCLAPIKSSLTSRSLGLPCPISAHHLFCSLFPQTCSPVLGSYQVLTHLKIAWFALSHLCPPPFLLTLSPDMFTSAWLLSSPHSPQDRLVCLVPSLPTTFFAHPFPRHVHQCLAPIKSSLTSRSLGLPCPISAHNLFCSPFPQTCSPVLGSYQVLTHLKIAWFALSHLCPPPFLLTLSPDIFASAWLLSSPRSPQDCLVCLVPSLPTTFFAHPFPRHFCQCLAPIKSSLTSRLLGLPCPISARHLVFSPFPQTCSPVLGSYQVLAHLKIAWFALYHLCPPPGLLTLPTQGSSTWLAGWGVDS